MSFLAKLHIEGVEHTILECSFGIGKDGDETGKPSSIAQAGQISLMLQVKQRDKIFFNWTRSTTMVKDGRVVFLKNDAMVVMDELVFKKAYCMHYGVEYHSEHGLIANIVLSAHEVTYGGDTHTNPWGDI